MHEIGHLAEESDRSPEQIFETMKKNGTYSLLQEEIARQKALDLLVENAVAVEMPEEEESESEEESEEEESVVEVGAEAQTNEGEEK